MTSAALYQKKCTTPSDLAYLQRGRSAVEHFSTLSYCSLMSQETALRLHGFFSCVFIPCTSPGRGVSHHLSACPHLDPACTSLHGQFCQRMQFFRQSLKCTIQFLQNKTLLFAFPEWKWTVKGKLLGLCILLLRKWQN